jgi:DNA-binding XRE family transcriptional regulator
MHHQSNYSAGRIQLGTRNRFVDSDVRSVGRESSDGLNKGQVNLRINNQPAGDIKLRFGVRLRELRISRNLTQIRMAVNFGIDRSFISDVERGRKSISLTFLEIIALGLDVNLSDLLRDI